jgi:hypothetical protein
VMRKVGLVITALEWGRRARWSWSKSLCFLISNHIQVNKKSPLGFLYMLTAENSALYMSWRNVPCPMREEILGTHRQNMPPVGLIGSIRVPGIATKLILVQREMNAWIVEIPVYSWMGSMIVKLAAMNESRR